MRALAMKGGRRINIYFAHKLFTFKFYFKKKIKSVIFFQGIGHLYLLLEKEFYRIL